MNKAFYKWQRNRRNKKKLVHLAGQIMSGHTMAFLDDRNLLEFARKLAAVNMTTVERIPGFLQAASDQQRAVNCVSALVEEKENANEMLLVLMNHFEHLVAVKPKIRSFASVASKQLVKDYRLHEWRLPLQRERQIIEVITSTVEKGNMVGEWIVPFMVNNPDKGERVIEMLNKRKVTTLQDMEALLEDDVPIVMQDGAL